MKLITPIALFGALLLLTCFVAELHHTVKFRPRSVHVWRQCDGASYTLNYYQNGNPFFQPATHTQTGEGGRTVSEFPIFYYLTAQLYRLFGFKEALLRLVHFSVFIAGAWALFLFAQRFLQHTRWAMALAFVFITSPYVFYYGPNFLPNVPAIGLALIGWYCFFHYCDTYRLSWWYACVGFSALAALVKISEGISFVSIAILVLAATHFKNGFATIENRDRLHRLLGCGIVLVLVFGWSQFATYYNKINHTGQNLLGIYPIWQMTRQEIGQTIERATGELPGFWRSSFHHSFILHLVAWSQLIFLVFFRRMHPLLRAITILLFLGVAAYSILWFKAFYHHDYYMLPLVVYPIFLLLTVLEFFAKTIQSTTARALLTSLGALAVATGIWHNGRIQHERYNDPLYLAMGINPAVYELEPYLRSLGIKHTDKVVSVPDGSPNISLYLMNQPGWTEIFNSPGYDIYYFQAQGAKYLIVNDSSYLQKPPYNNFTQNKIGEYKGVSVFDIQKK